MKLRHLIFSLTSLVLPAAGANVTWDADTLTTGSQDGGGSWNTTNTNWWSGSANVSFIAGDNVTFGSGTGAGAAGSIAVDAGGVSVGTLTFNAPGSSSYTFTGGSITGGALVKNGANGLRFDNANSFTSVTINGGPNSSVDGAIRLGNANALGTAPVTFANTATMTGLNFLTGFGTATTFSNNIAFASGAVQTNLVATAGIGQTVTLGGVISGGNSGATLFLNNSASGGVAKFRLTNASNSVLGTWRLNRGALEFTSDAALGNAANDLTLDVTGSTAGTGLTFGANNIALNSGRSVSVVSQTIIDTGSFTGSSITGQITGAGNLVRRGTTSLVPANNTNTHSGGWTIATAPATGSAQGALHLTAASRNVSNVFSGLGTGAITATSAGTILSAALAGTASNNIVLPNTATRHDFVAANGTELTLSGVISGGGVSIPTFYVNTDTGGGSTGLIKLTGTNTFIGRVQINRGGLAINSNAALGDAANSVFLDIGTNTQVGLRFDAAMSSSRGIQLGAGKQVLNTNGNNVTLSGVLSGTGELHKLGAGTLTLSNSNTFTGLTQITTGTLALAGSGSIASPSISVGASTTFDVSGLSGGYTIAAAQTLSGTGTVAGNLTIAGTHSPGTSPGLQTFTGNLSYAATSTVNVEMVGDTLGIRGTDYDAIDVTGGNLAIDPSAGFNLIASAINYAAAAWDVDRSFTIIDLNGGSFSGGLFNLNTSSAGTFSGEGSWSLSSVGGDVVLNWTAVPEPGAALLGGIGFLALLRRRR